MAGNEVDVDPEVLDGASAEVGAVVDEHDGYHLELGGGEYGHDGLAAAATAFAGQLDQATVQLVVTIDVLAGELVRQAESYRAVDEQVCTAFSSPAFPALGGAMLPGFGPTSAPSPFFAGPQAGR